MSNQITEEEKLLKETQDVQVAENTAHEEDVLEHSEPEGTSGAAKPKFGKKAIVVIAAVAVIVIIALVLFIPSEFERVHDECTHIAGRTSGGGDYFTIDTYPDEYKNMDELVASMLLPKAQENALKAIKYANEELGFNGSLYSQMTHTSALMGRQSAENDKYRVSWSYHPDRGLEVTYEKK